MFSGRGSSVIFPKEDHGVVGLSSTGCTSSVSSMGLFCLVMLILWVRAYSGVRYSCALAGAFSGAWRLLWILLPGFTGRFSSYRMHLLRIFGS